jgi:anti-sigma-K factor RskA
MECEEVRELLDAHSLGALERSEARQVEKHLARCADCRRLHQEAMETSAALALATPLRRASPALLLRLRRKIAPRSALRWFPAPQARWAAVAAVLAVVSLGALTWGVLLQTQVNGLRADSDRFAALYEGLGKPATPVDLLQRALTESAFREEELQDVLQEQEQVTRVVALGDESGQGLVATAPASPARGRYVWSEEEGLGVLFLINLSQLSEDQEYQLWLLNPLEGGVPVSGGTFRPQPDGSARLLVRGGEVAGTGLTGMAITIEPVGGSETPTGEIVLQGIR